jgi:hypothetical protein
LHETQQDVYHKGGDDGDNVADDEEGSEIFYT